MSDKLSDGEIKELRVKKKQIYNELHDKVWTAMTEQEMFQELAREHAETWKVDGD